MVNGVLIVDKPQEWTSFDVVAKLRRIYNTKKVGHSGTLDPMATGVLPIFFGHSTKFIRFLPSKVKGYIADVTFGLSTDTDDITGTVIERCDYIPTEEQLLKTLNDFVGEITQVPPIYSAIKKDGKPLYKFARAGIATEIPSRVVTIHSISLLSFKANVATIEVSCSEGSYIRSLARDIAVACDSRATLSALRRTQSGGCTLDGAVTLDNLMLHPEPQSFLMPTEKLFTDLPRLILPQYRVTRLKNGLTQEVADINGLACLYEENDFVGLVEGNGELIKAVRMCQY